MNSFFQLNNQIEPLFETSNYEEAQAILSNLIGPHQSTLLDSQKPFFCRYYHTSLHQSSLIYLQWQGKQKLTRDQPDDLYVFYLPLEGEIEERIDHLDKFYSSPKIAHLFTPQQTLIGQIDSRGQGISVCINRHILEKELSKLLNAPINRLVTFFPEVDLTQNFGHSLKELILFTWQATTSNSLFLPQLEQILLTSLLQNQHHNYTSWLNTTEGDLAARQIRLAQEFIRANLERSISLGDIASAIGVSGRSLQRAFAKYSDCSPIQFLRQVRLDALHEELKKGTPLLGITDLMIKYQFSHFGRCSQSYQQRFGELPSETVKRSFFRGEIRANSQICP